MAFLLFLDLFLKCPLPKEFYKLTQAKVLKLIQANNKKNARLTFWQPR